MRKTAEFLGRRAAGLRGSDVATVARTLGISAPAARVVKNALQGEDMEAAARALIRAGDDAMLADAGPGTAALLDAAVSSGGNAARVGRDAVDGRAAAANDLLGSKLDQILGEPRGVATSARSIAPRTARLRQAAYDFAYTRPIDYASEAGRAIEDMIGRIPSRVLRSAVQRANEQMVAEGRRNQQIMARIADDGTVTFEEMPNVQQLDQIKRVLSGMASDAQREFGQATEDSRFYGKLAEGLRDAVRRAVPAYGAALRVGGDKIAEENAYRLGLDLLRTGTRREDVFRTMHNASEDVKVAIRKGLREHIDETVENVARTITDGNTDARAAMKVVRDMSSAANRTKVEAAIGKAEAKDLFSALDEAAARLELRAAIATNSKTAQRQGIRDEVQAQVSPGVLGRLLEGKPAGAVESTIQALTGASPEARVLREQGIWEEIARAVTQVRGPAAQSALRVIQSASEGQMVTEAQAKLVARMLTRPAAAVTYQANVRPQTTP